MGARFLACDGADFHGAACVFWLAFAECERGLQSQCVIWFVTGWCAGVPFFVEMEVCFLEVAGLGCSEVLCAGSARLFSMLG